MRLLIDSNIVLEVLLGQSRAAEAQELLRGAARHELYLSDFSFHSIGLLLVRQGKSSVFRRFVSDLILDAGVQLVSLGPQDVDLILDAASRFQLDFDDAYQHAIAERHDLTIVSFDGDFDRTARGRRVPASIALS